MIATWAARWGIPPAAIHELQQLLGAVTQPAHGAQPTGSEAAVQNAVRMEAARRGYRLWRNNSGVAMSESGQPVRYGLCNESQKINRIVKSSDLIGISPRGLFVARECKPVGWKYTGDQPCICKPHGPICKHCHEKAQLAFITLIVSMGGDAAFITAPEQLP